MEDIQIKDLTPDMRQNKWVGPGHHQWHGSQQVRARTRTHTHKHTHPPKVWMVYDEQKMWIQTLPIWIYKIKIPLLWKQKHANIEGVLELEIKKKIADGRNNESK